MLVTLSPSNSWEFLAAMTQAWEWAQARKRFYCATGGEQGVDEYLEAASAPNVRQIAIVRKGQVKAIVTVRQVGRHAFDVHVTAPKGADVSVVLAGLLRVRSWLFNEMGAVAVFTTCGTYNGHRNKSSRWLAESCGMAPSGEEREQVAADGTHVIWREYVITREKYNGQS